MTFSELVSAVKTLNSNIGGEWQPEFQLLWIYEEMGELSSELLKYSKLPAKLHNDSQEQVRSHIKEELGDVLYGLVSLSQNLEIPLEEALAYSLTKFQQRHQEM